LTTEKAAWGKRGCERSRETARREVPTPRKRQGREGRESILRRMAIPVED
jgi:hypothetical protein